MLSQWNKLWSSIKIQIARERHRFGEHLAKHLAIRETVLESCKMAVMGIDAQTVFGMPPVEHVRLAAELGCAHISIGLGPPPWNPRGFRNWSLRSDVNLRREMMNALRETGVSISLGEGFAIRANADIRERASDLDLLFELGARRVSSVCMESDLARSLDQLAIIADMTAERGMELTLEFAPPHAVANLKGALHAIEYIGRKNVRLVIDAMHFFRSGGTVSELASLNPELIGYVQLCDVPLVPDDGDYMQEACFRRLIPGAGELPLVDLISVLPEGLVIGIEVPMLAEAEAGRLRSTVARAVAAAGNLLSMPKAVAPFASTSSNI